MELKKLIIKDSAPGGTFGHVPPRHNYKHKHTTLIDIRHNCFSGPVIAKHRETIAKDVLNILAYISLDDEFETSCLPNLVHRSLTSFVLDHDLTPRDCFDVQTPHENGEIKLKVTNIEARTTGEELRDLSEKCRSVHNSEVIASKVSVFIVNNECSSFKITFFCSSFGTCHIRNQRGTQLEYVNLSLKQSSVFDDCFLMHVCCFCP